MDAGAAGRARVGDAVRSAVLRLEDATGLKLQETLGVARAVDAQTRGAAKVVQQTAEDTGAVLLKKVEEAKSAIVETVHEAVAEKKVDEAAMKKAEEPPKRLV